VRDQTLEAPIDVRPFTDSNRINLGNPWGLVPVTVMSTSQDDGEAVDFDATSIDINTVSLGDPELSGRADPFFGFRFDIDFDGDRDLILFFATHELRSEGALNTDSTTVELTGQTTDGTQFVGTDTVNVVDRSPWGWFGGF